MKPILKLNIVGKMLLSTAVLFGELPAARFQTPTELLAFEVATIKPHPKGGVNASITDCRGLDSPPNRAVRLQDVPIGEIPTFASTALGRCKFSNVTLKRLIDWSYKLDIVPWALEQKILGGPAWAASDSFDIEAKAENPSTVTADQFRQMAQTLLAQRFGLKFHRETREITGFVLLLAKNGPKLTVSSGTGTGGSRGTRDRSGLSRSTGEHRTAADIAEFLWSKLSLPVIDRTGLTGFYDYTLRWTDDLDTAPADALAPSLLTALQEQLGLRLEAQKVPIEVIAIDHAEKPSTSGPR